MVFNELSDYLIPCCEHYLSLGIDFDAVYSGFLASSAQIDGCLHFFNNFSNALKIVDPVMGDNGKPYKTYTKEMCKRMSELVRVADIITPNLTEAAMLLEESYTPELSENEAKGWLKRLNEHTPTVIITGVVIDGNIYNIGIDKSGAFYKVKYEHIPAHYPGTGDIFASVLTGKILLCDNHNLSNLQAAIKNATEFARLTVKTTYEFGGEPRNGVMLEKLLPKLM